MTKKTPEEIEALKQAAAQKKEAGRLAAEKKAAEDKAAAERAELLKRLEGFTVPFNPGDLSNEELKLAVAAIEAEHEKAAAERAAVVKDAANKNNLENISNIANKEKVPALFIKSVPESFCRCGRRFTREGYGIALDILTTDEIERLKSEPNLVVEEVEALLD